MPFLVGIPQEFDSTRLRKKERGGEAGGLVKVGVLQSQYKFSFITFVE